MYLLDNQKVIAKIILDVKSKIVIDPLQRNQITEHYKD